MRNGRAARMQGVEVKRRATNGRGERRAAEVLIRRICVRYEDGRRACFVLEAGEEFFSRDDVHRVVGICTPARRTASGGWRSRRGALERDRTTPAPSEQPAAHLDDRGNDPEAHPLRTVHAIDRTS
jgi:hypothetical protein